MDVQLHLSWTGADAEAIHDLTVEFARDLGLQLATPGGVRLLTEPADGAKGDALTVGGLVVLIAALRPSVNALILVLKPYFARRPSLSVTLEHEGNRIVITSRDIAPNAVENLLVRISTLIATHKRG